MRPTLVRYITVLPRSAVPKYLQERILRPPHRLTERLVEPTLIDHLISLREARKKAYGTAKQNLQETGQLEVDPSVQSWPENLRIEPVVKREAFAKVTKEARAQLKQALKER